MQLNRYQSGFSLVEMAIVLTIVGLLLGMGMASLSAMKEVRDFNGTESNLAYASDAIFGFATVNKRLPCPARYVNDTPTGNSGGLESFCTGATGTCVGTETTTVQAHGNCSNFYDGYLPAASIGYTPVDAKGFALDAYGNRLRYAIARDFVNGSCPSAPPANTRIWSSQANIKAYGIGCKPNDLDICTDAACTSRVVTTQTAAIVVYSTGANGSSTGSYGNDETENTNGDGRFVLRTFTDAGTTAGKYDDIVQFYPVGVLYQKLLNAGVLP